MCWCGLFVAVSNNCSFRCILTYFRTCFIVHAKVDLLTVTVTELHARLVKFGSEHVGSTFQDAMMDPNFVDYVLKWMQPKSFEEQLFKKYVKLVLEDFKQTAEVFQAAF